MKTNDQSVSVYFVKIIRETPGSVHVQCADGREVFVPFSQISEIHRTNPPVIVMSRWLALKEDLIGQSALIARPT